MDSVRLRHHVSDYLVRHFLGEHHFDSAPLDQVLY